MAAGSTTHDAADIGVAVHKRDVLPGDEHLDTVRALPLVFSLRHGHGVSLSMYRQPEADITIPQSMQTVTEVMLVTAC